MNRVPFIPESAPFTPEQRAWLNGFLAGLHSSAPVEAVPAAPKNTEPLLVLFGSQTGSAEGLAKKVAKESELRGFAPKILPLNDYEQANLAAAGKAVIISSTWGDGEPPDNAVKFWNWLKADSAPRLENLNFAVLGLGDKNYSDFCGASKKFDSRLEALGAKRLAPRGECDTDYETAAKNWMDGLWEKLGGSTNGASKNGSHPAPPAVSDDEKRPAPAFSKSHPFPARLLKNLALNRDGSAKEVRHYEIALGGSGLAYEVGDALGVMPENCDALVTEVLAALGATGDEPVVLENSVLPLRLALAQNFELGKPTAELLAEIARRAPASELAPLLAPEQSRRFEKMAPRSRCAGRVAARAKNHFGRRTVAAAAKIIAAPLLHFFVAQGASRRSASDRQRRALRKPRPRPQRRGFDVPRRPCG